MRMNYDLPSKVVNCLLFFILCIGISVHPLFVADINLALPYFHVFGKLLIVICFTYLFLNTIKLVTNESKKIFFPFFILNLIVTISIYQILFNDIKEFPSFFILMIFMYIFILFYTFSFDKSFFTLNLLKYVSWKKKTTMNLFYLLSLFLLILMFLEIYIKYAPELMLLKNNLRESGFIVFPWRLTGFLLDANRWALFLLFLYFILNFIEQALDIKNNLLRYVILFYIFTTLSKTALVILLLIFLIDISSLFKKLSLKHFFYIVFSISFIIISFELSGYEYSNSALERKIDFTIESLVDPANARTVNEREETYKAAIDSIENHLLFGKGYLNFTAETSEQIGITVHNTILALMAYFGVLQGIVIFIFLFIVPFIWLFVKYGYDKELFKLFVTIFIFFNLLSVAHDLIIVMFFYTSLTIYVLTKPLQKIGRGSNHAKKRRHPNISYH